MNLETPSQKLKFLWVKWPIAQVEFWINRPTTGLDYFLFDFHFPATNDPSLPLGLCAFAHNSTPPGYFNPYNPDILLPYESNAALFSGPIKLTSNILSVAEIQTLIGPDPSGKEYLLFTPNLNTDRQVYYDVTVVPSAGSKVGVTVTAKTATPEGGGGSSTNPSPPATI
jgi:hypothetical protein